MKILFITGSLNQGGAEYQILELAKLFQNKGNEVEVFAITDYDFYKPFIEENKIRYNHLLNNQSKIKRVFLTIKKIRKEKPEIIISYLRMTSQVTLFAKILSGVRSNLIVGERTSLILPKYDKYYFNLMRMADYITVNSVSKLRYLERNFPKIKNKTKFFPNIIDTEKFRFIKKNYDNNRLKIGFVGRVSPEKNLLKLIEAVSFLIKEGNDVELLIYGDTKNLKYLVEVNDLIEKSSLGGKIIFKGKISKIYEAYKEIDLLCLVSTYEGFSNALSEGLTCGLPIITSDIEENTFLIEDKVNGFVVNHLDSNEIAKGIYDYIKLPLKSKLEMALNNRKKAESMFNQENIYGNYMKMINKIEK